MKNTIKKCGQLFLLAVLALAIMLFGSLIGDLMAIPLHSSSNPAIVFAGDYFAYIGRWILVIGYCLLVKKNRKLFPMLGKGGRGNKAGTVFAIGIPCGLGLNLLIGLLAMVHGDIKLTYAGFDLPLILLLLVCVTVQSGAEEIVCRWFLYQKARELFPNKPLLPVIFTAVFFSLVHLLNPGITFLASSNIVLVGILYALIVYYFDSFWACVAAHTGWNFCQSVILGLPNSGIVSDYSIFRLDTSCARNSFAYNTEFGIEGTVMSSVLLLAAIVIIAITGRRNKNNRETSGIFTNLFES